MKFHAVAIAVALVISSAALASPQDPAPSAEQVALAQRARDMAIAPIKSLTDLGQYLQATPKGRSPLDLLTRAAKQRFLASLTFNEGGLTSYDYSDLRIELTTKQIYDVLSLFGAQGTISKIPTIRAESTTDKLILAQPLNTTGPTMEDHEGYKCEGSHTCVTWSGRICMSGC